MARWHGVKLWVQTRFQICWVVFIFKKINKRKMPFLTFPFFKKGDDVGLVTTNTFSTCFQGSCRGSSWSWTDIPWVAFFVFVWRMYYIKQLAFKYKTFVHVEMRKSEDKSYSSLDDWLFLCGTIKKVRHSVWHQKLLSHKTSWCKCLKGSLSVRWGDDFDHTAFVLRFTLARCRYNFIFCRHESNC